LGIKAFEVRALPEKIRVSKIAGTLEAIEVGKIQVRPFPLSVLTKVEDIGAVTPKGKRGRGLKAWRPLRVVPQKVVRLAGLALGKDEKMNVRFLVKFPKNAGTRNVTLAFRERDKGRVLGQMNYVFRIRKAQR
jgi:hypothetical protein